jgi:hypothetical protein
LYQNNTLIDTYFFWKQTHCSQEARKLILYEAKLRRSGNELHQATFFIGEAKLNNSDTKLGS